MLLSYEAIGLRPVDAADEIAGVLRGMQCQGRVAAFNGGLRWLFIVLLVFGLIMLGGTFGFTWLVVSSIKDTRLSPDGGSALLAKTGGAVLETASFSVQQRLSSEAGMDALAQLKQLRIISSSSTATAAVAAAVAAAAGGGGAAELLVAVQGAARLPEPASTYGSVLLLFTSVGMIELDGGRVRFKDDVAPVFRAAGFEIANEATKSADGSQRLRLTRDASVSGVFGNKVAVPLLSPSPPPPSPSPAPPPPPPPLPPRKLTQSAC